MSAIRNVYFVAEKSTIVVLFGMAVWNEFGGESAAPSVVPLHAGRRRQLVHLRKRGWSLRTCGGAREGTISGTWSGSVGNSRNAIYAVQNAAGALTVPW